MSPQDDSADRRRITTQLDDGLVTEVIQMVAELAGKEPEALPPLHNVVDTDALEAIFRTKFDQTARGGGGMVVFPYAGYHVVVTSDHEIEISPIENDG